MAPPAGACALGDRATLALRQLTVVLYEHMNLEEQLVMPIVPSPLRADMLPVAPGVYADYADRVYGTRTPPRANDVVVGTPAVSTPAVSAATTLA